MISSLEPEGEWVKVGDVAVDTGMVLIGDPCNLLDQPGCELKPLAKNWPEFVSLIEEPNMLFQRFEVENGRCDRATIVSSGRGDGVYPVYVKIIEHESGHDMVTEARIFFDDVPFEVDPS